MILQQLAKGYSIALGVFATLIQLVGLAGAIKNRAICTRTYIIGVIVLLIISVKLALAEIIFWALSVWYLLEFVVFGTYAIALEQWLKM